MESFKAFKPAVGQHYLCETWDSTVMYVAEVVQVEITLSGQLWVTYRGVEDKNAFSCIGMTFIRDFRELTATERILYI
jgi:hypothetical protein